MMHKGNLAVASLNAYLIRVRLMGRLTIAQRGEVRQRLKNLNTRIIGWCRKEDNPMIDWASYPVARDWFTQN